MKPQPSTAGRQRFRQVSPERIAKTVAAMQAKGIPCSVKLTVDGSALLLTGEQAEQLTPDQGEGPNEWDRRFGFA